MACRKLAVAIFFCLATWAAHASGLHDMAEMTVTGTPGTGTFTLNAAVSDFQTFAASGVINGEIVSYSAEGAAGWETGRGTYTSSGTLLTRGPLYSSNSNAAVNFGSDVVVWIALLSEDLSQGGASPNSLSAQAFSGADPCAQIAAAFTAAYNASPKYHTVDASGFTAISACAGSMFSPWYTTPSIASPAIPHPTSSATIFPATLIWGSVPLPVGSYPQIIPPGVQVVTKTPANGPAWTVTPNIPVSQSVLAGAQYASPSGSGSACTVVTTPCTLAGAKAAAVAASAGNGKTIYLRAGTYTLTSAGTACSASDGLEITAAGDTGTTYSYYPPDGYNTAIITGANAVNTGLCIGVGGLANNVTINGIQITGFVTLIAKYSGPNFILNNMLHDTTAGNSGTATFTNNAPYIAANNLVYNITNEGFNAVAPSAGNNSTLDGTIYANNVLINICTFSADCGALYIEDLATTTHSAGIFIINNYVVDGSVIGGIGSGEGIYLDEGSSNVVVAGNIVTGRAGDNTMFIGGGNNNSVFGNIFDLTGTARYLVGLLDYHASIALNTFSGDNFFSNIYLSNGTNGAGQYASINTLTNTPTVSNNIYWAYAGSAIATTGVGGGTAPADSNPRVVNPLLSGPFQLAPGSPAYSPPVNFPPITGGWGPPGYQMPPAQGTTPSFPNSGILTDFGNTVTKTTPGTNQFVPLSGTVAAALTTEATASSLVPTVTTFSHLTCSVSTAPTSTNTDVCTIRIASAPAGTASNGNETCTITGTATSCTDLVHTDVVAAGSGVDIEILPSASAVTAYVAWGINHRP